MRDTPRRLEVLAQWLQRADDELLYTPQEDGLSVVAYARTLDATFQHALGVACQQIDEAIWRRQWVLRRLGRQEARGAEERAG
jgi:hypothetical protein